ncbi:MAG TPA: hypothetical protein VLB80_04020 [Candidatus Babeliales bacterium]|nr:hypothetical protein [Candidatus Babeliales bacterium]
MNKNNLLHCLFLLSLIIPSSILSMVTKQSTLLQLSTIFTPMPTEEGMSLWRKGQDLIYGEEINILADLENKTFNLNNEDYYNQLNSALAKLANINLAFDKNDTDKNLNIDRNNNQIMKILHLCIENYPLLLKINDIPACKVHASLARENNKKQRFLRETIESKDKEFIKQQNILLAALQKTIVEQVTTIDNNFRTHEKEKENIIEEECAKIRNLKTGLMNIHSLNTTFKLPVNEKNDINKDGYCSDNDNKKPDNEKNTYNNEFLLKKINAAYKMQQTKLKIEQLLQMLQAIVNSTQEIEPLVYTIVG